MKKNLITLSLLLFTLSFVYSDASAQRVLSRNFSTALANTNPDALRVEGSLITHDGNPQTALTTGLPTFVGTFGPTAKWIGIGAPVTPGNLLYGERTQWNEQAFIKALRQRSTTDVTKDAILEWGGGIAAQAASEMQFRHITNPASPTGFTRILTMNTAGNSYFGLSPAIGNPKLGVSTTNQFGFSSRTENNIAGYFFSNATVNSFTRGVFAFANGSTLGGFTAGVTGIVGNNNAANNRRNYGVFASAPVSPTATNGNIFTSYAAFFQGDTYMTGSQYGSDAKYKINITAEVGALSKILATKPVSYNFDTVTFRAYNFSPRRQHGFIAQEIQAVFPEAVQNATLSLQDETGRETANNVGLSLNYISLISVLYRGVQEQQTQINELRQRLGLPPVTATNAAEMIAAAEKNAGSPIADIELAPARRINTSVGEFTAADFKMEQNVPNPFSGNTVIKYTLPNKISNAFIAVYNLQGTQLLRFDRLNGGSQITINAGTLQPGIYIYALVAEGQEIISKRMVVAK
jgi:Chaperone of endosialidase/Secretion system C-terminal sorting domain